jgi:hypothetical protein
MINFLLGKIHKTGGILAIIYILLFQQARKRSSPIQIISYRIYHGFPARSDYLSFFFAILAISIFILYFAILEKSRIIFLF